MRTKNSIKNMIIGIASQIIITLLGFISRKVFLSNLGVEYLGINSLLSDVLSMLSLVEGGVGVSIVYNLYKPLAEDDKPRIIALVQLYKKVYIIFAIVILCLSLSLYPFLGILLNSEDRIPYLSIVYFIFVGKNMISYLNAHKWSLINADQKGYILTKYNLIFNVITTICKIIIIQITSSYILFLLVELGIFIFQNIWNGIIVNKRYSYIKTKEKYEIDKETKENLFVNTKAMLLHNIGKYCVFGTDNILMTIYINVKVVGLYSNYTMIMGQLSALFAPILGGIASSVGNLIATEGKEKNYKVFNITYLINFWIYSFSVVFLFNLLEPFINWCFGEGMLLDKTTFLIILVNFYITGLRSSIITFKTKAGIFKEDKYVPLIESITNLIVSIVLVKYLGIVGIFLGTTISTLVLPFWISPKLVYENVFGKSVYDYLKKYILYGMLTIITCCITSFLCKNLVNGSDFVSLVFRGIICLIVPNVFYLIIFFRTEEFQYLRNIINPIFIKVKLKLVKQ